MDQPAATVDKEPSPAADGVLILGGPDEGATQTQHLQTQQTPEESNGGSTWEPNRKQDDQAEASDSPKPAPCMAIIHDSHEPLRLKDFDTEVRALMDIEQFVHQAQILLSLPVTPLDMMLGTILCQVSLKDRLLATRVDEAKRAILVPGSSSLIARTIQGVSFDQKLGHLKYDESWLCAICDLDQVQERHMILVRFDKPMDLGSTARDVTLFALILCPASQRTTKSSLETGRTFATMLIDPDFRQGLLEAKTQLVFRSLMLIRAKELANKQLDFKNRHKYLVDPAVSLTMSWMDEAKREKSACKETIMNGRHQVLEDYPAGLNGMYKKHPNAGKLIELLDQTSVTTFDGSADVYSSGSARGEGGHLSRIFRHLEFGVGFCEDVSRRFHFYGSDFKDAFVGPPRTVQKTIATTWFLYFGILLPTIAFSALNTVQTNGHMGDLRQALIGQAIGGLAFALLGGQPLVIIMTTAPLCLYTSIIYRICLDYGFDFPSMYAAVGLWNGLFLIVYSLFGFSKLMNWCTRSTEEIFALFIVVALITDACRDMFKNFTKFYFSPACESFDDLGVASPPLDLGLTRTNVSTSATMDELPCRRETSILFVLLMLGTLWLALTLKKANKTPYFNSGVRLFLSDYAMPIAVVALSYVGSFVFSEVHGEKYPTPKELGFDRAKIEHLTLGAVITSAILGFTLSLLFFMDQNISAAMVGAPQHNLKKGNAYHLDLFVVAVLNAFLTMFRLPMMHGVLPHSPLHARSLADIEERVDEGHRHEVITNVRETRVTAIASHVLILASLVFIPYPIVYIPTAVLNGLFLFMAVSSLDGLHMFDRILLFFTEQNKYPPSHYVRKCPQRQIHLFTVLQIGQLLVFCLFGFSPIHVIEMFFPVIILMMVVFRQKFIPKYVDQKCLDALDGKH